MQLPFKAKDWWVYLIPGMFFTVLLIFLHDILVMLYAKLSKFLDFYYNVGEIVPCLFSASASNKTIYGAVYLIFSLLIGVFLYEISYYMNEKHLLSPIERQFLDLNKILGNKLVKIIDDEKIFPQSLNPSKFKINWADLGGYIEYYIWYHGKEGGIKSIDTTYSAWLFSISFYYPLALSIVIIPVYFLTKNQYLIVSIYVIISIISLFIIRRTKQSLANEYWAKIFNFYFVHFFEGKPK